MGRFHAHFKADLLQPSHQPSGAAERVKTVVMEAAEFLICGSFTDDVPGNSQYPVRDCHGC